MKLRLRARTNRLGADGGNARATGAAGPIPAVFIALVMWAIPVMALWSVRPEHADGLALLRDGILLMIALATCAVALKVFSPAAFRSNRLILLMTVTSLFSLAPAVLISWVCARYDAPAWLPPAQVFLFPLALAPILATILVDQAVGVTLGIWIALSASVVFGHSTDALLAGLVSSTLGSYLSRNVRRRATLLRIGMLVGLSEIFVVVANGYGLLAIADPGIIVVQAAACLVNGGLTAVAVLMVLPLFESVFKCTTDIRLLELSDLGHPLMQRLAIEAPGTYHHSLVVANLAQAAAGETGANPLLARVCSHFHDVGKLTKPEFFSENIMWRANPHDELSPTMSTLVITAHVKEGISLGLLHKLPPAIITAIREHHGTGIVQYFHHKARRQMEMNSRPEKEDRPVDEQSFRYPGPKPTSKESAIVSLADSAEAASRSLEKPTPGRIEDLVNEVVEAKMLDGQLDDCPLTMDDIRKTKRSFIFTLSTMLHARVSYPGNEDINSKPADGVKS